MYFYVLSLALSALYAHFYCFLSLSNMFLLLFLLSIGLNQLSQQTTNTLDNEIVSYVGLGITYAYRDMYVCSSAYCM